MAESNEYLFCSLDDGSISSSSRRVSNSSATTYSDGSSYIADLDNAKREAQARMIIRHNRQPYAALNELVQADCISDLVCEFTQELEQFWRANVRCSKYGPEMFTTMAKAGSKAKAKASASKILLYKLFPESELCAQSNIPTKSDVAFEEPSLTKRQSTEYVRDQHAQSVLDAMLPYRTLMGHKTIFLSLDLEVYELDHKYLTEVGFAYMTGATSIMQEGSISSTHYVIAENSHYRNGRYCADEQDNFRFGLSQTIPEEQVMADLKQKLDTLAHDADRVFIIGHSIDGDLEWLKAHNVDMYDIVNQQCSTQVCDIARVYRAMQCDRTYQGICGMSKIMEYLGVESTGIHNAGNDATFNLQVLQRMMDKATTWEDGYALL